MPKESTNLLLSEVQEFDPHESSICKVHYDGFAGKGRDWEYKAGGNPFEYKITSQQANLLSKLQNNHNGWKLSAQEQEVMKGIPPELVGKWRDQTHVTGSAQVALYDLVK